MRKKSPTTLITEEMIRALSGNPNVEKITEKSIFFTKAFKEKLYKEKETGKPIKEILRENGIDPEILGESRISGLSYLINMPNKKGRRVKDRLNNEYVRIPIREDEPVEERVKQLEHELAYTRQEVEFLKKLRMADMEAQEQWESKHRQE